VGGATITAQRVGVLLPGGSSQVRYASRTTFTRAIVAVDGIKGYYEVTLPTPDTVAVLIITTAQQPPQTAFQLRHAAGTGANLSSYATENVTLTRVGAGVIQATVQWSTATDVDLSLVEPGGREVSFSSPVSAGGAQLDLDSNSRCVLDDRNNENITYAAGRTPPSGQYIVRVNYWSACDVTTPTFYVVTLTVRGVTQTFTGTLTGRGTQGGAGVEVTRFTF
jgi:voltage-gated potassium channel Kch